MKKIFILLAIIILGVGALIIIYSVIYEPKEPGEENIGNELEKTDLIWVDYPGPNQKIESPLVVQGEAMGYWFFEASFPVILADQNGLTISQGIAQAKEDWMTEEFVQFEAVLEFERPESGNKGTLILKKDNPSGLPEYDDALEIPIIFK